MTTKAEPLSMWNHPTVQPAESAGPTKMTPVQMPTFSHEDFRYLINAAELACDAHSTAIMRNPGHGRARLRDYHKRQLLLYRELARKTTLAFLAS